MSKIQPSKNCVGFAHLYSCYLQVSYNISPSKTFRRLVKRINVRSAATESTLVLEMKLVGRLRANTCSSGRRKKEKFNGLYINVVT